MRRLSRDDVREALADTVTNGRRIHLPADFDDVDWERLDYLGWQDRRSPLRSYLIAEADERVVGIGLERVAPSQETYGRAVICNLCRFSRRFHEVSMFVTRNPSAPKRQQLNAVGTMLCTDLDCATNVHTTHLQGSRSIAERRDDLRRRVASFVRSAQRATVPGKA